MTNDKSIPEPPHEVVVPPPPLMFVSTFVLTSEEMAKHIQNDIEYRNRVIGNSPAP